MSPKLFRSDETRQWLRYAQEDLAAAEILTNTSPPLLKVALFHCQQAVEKSFKAFLVWHEQPFTRSHDLVPLADQCAIVDHTLEEIVIEALPLNQFAVRFRYPGEPAEPTVDETRQWLSTTRTVLNAIVERLPRELQR